MLIRRLGLNYGIKINFEEEFSLFFSDFTYYLRLDDIFVKYYTSILKKTAYKNYSDLKRRIFLSRLESLLTFKLVDNDNSILKF